MPLSLSDGCNRRTKSNLFQGLTEAVIQHVNITVDDLLKPSQENPILCTPLCIFLPTVFLGGLALVIHRGCTLF